MQQLVDAQPRSREHPQAQRRIVTPAFEAILDEVVETFSLSGRAELRRKSRSNGRKALAHLAWKEGALPLVTIAEWLGVSGRGVSKMIEVSRERELSDSQYRDQLARLRRRLLGEG
jgi:hypothetical protein